MVRPGFMHAGPVAPWPLPSTPTHLQKPTNPTAAWSPPSSYSCPNCITTLQLLLQVLRPLCRPKKRPSLQNAVSFLAPSSPLAWSQLMPTYQSSHLDALDTGLSLSPCEDQFQRTSPLLPIEAPASLFTHASSCARTRSSPAHQQLQLLPRLWLSSTPTAASSTSPCRPCFYQSPYQHFQIVQAVVFSSPHDALDTLPPSGLSTHPTTSYLCTNRCQLQHVSSHASMLACQPRSAHFLRTYAAEKTSPDGQ